MISEQLRMALLVERSRGVKQYEIAKRCGIHPTVVSAIMSEGIPVRRGDRRVVALGKTLGLTEEQCFEEGSVPPARVPPNAGRT